MKKVKQTFFHIFASENMYKFKREKIWKILSVFFLLF